MASLIGILPENWNAKAKKDLIPKPPQEQAYISMVEAGIENTPDHIIMDGQVHRFKAGGKDKSGWYVFFDGPISAGAFGDWRSGIEQTWRQDLKREISHTERLAFEENMRQAKEKAKKELAMKHENAAGTASKVWLEASMASDGHPYLVKKGIQPHGAKIHADGRLIVPLFDADGCISSVQYISHDSSKLYEKGGETKGKFWCVGDIEGQDTIYISEGFATAATIHEVTQKPCVVAYSASNIVPVTEVIRDQNKSSKLIIVADNDQSGIGRKYADQAAAKYGASVIMPPEPGDANDYHANGNDLKGLLEPEQNQWLVWADEFCEQPAPLQWHVKGWLQKDSLMMVHGPSGCGKTFVVLDWCLRIATDTPEWYGKKVRPGVVAYLAGEGHHGLKGRIKAWKQHNQPENPTKMVISKSGCDLNTPQGFQKAVESISAMPEPPSIIVVDTLHRFLRGDENSAQDARTMLDACSALMQMFDCSVLLVHHTGVSGEAQHRARGSSAWRGALDIEISITARTESKPIEIIQRKNKDAEESESLAVELESIPLEGWFDEDGEQVTSAIIVPTEKTVKPPKESKNDRHMREFTNIFWWSGGEFIDDQAYISRSAIIRFYTTERGMKDSSAKQMAKESATGKMICDLLTNGLIKKVSHGWSICDNILNSSLKLQRPKTD